MKWCCFVDLDVFGIMIGWIGVFMSTIHLIVSVGEIVYKINTDKPQSSHWLIVLWVILISSVFLIAGVMNDNHLMLLPWMITAWILLFCHSIIQLRSIEKLIDMKAVDWNSVDTEFVIGYTIVALLAIFFHYYANFAIHALYKQIENKYVLCRMPMTMVITEV